MLEWNRELGPSESFPQRLSLLDTSPGKLVADLVLCDKKERHVRWCWDCYPSLVELTASVAGCIVDGVLGGVGSGAFDRSNCMT